MVREKLYVVVSDSPRSDPDASDETRAFEAGRWLAYADQTDTIGYASFVQDAHHIDGATHITFEVPLLSGDERVRFIDEMDTLSRVERFDFGKVSE